VPAGILEPIVHEKDSRTTLRQEKLSVITDT
jgi:hypothetical protein